VHAHRVLPGNLEREGMEQDNLRLGRRRSNHAALLSAHRPAAGLSAEAAPQEKSRKALQDVREDCIQIMLLVADGGYSGDVRETLMEQDKFRDYFNEKMAPDRNRWHDFQNNLDEHYLRELLTCMEIFRDEIAFILNNTDIPKDEPFDYLKQLSAAIYSMKDVLEKILRGPRSARLREQRSHPTLHLTQRRRPQFQRCLNR
jgi:hypothetical protein